MSPVLEAPVIELGRLNARIEIPPELTVLEDDVAPPGHGMFRIMTAKDGDKRVVWNSAVLQDIAAARKMFMDCVRQGLVPYRVGVDGKAYFKSHGRILMPKRKKLCFSLYDLLG